MEKKLSKKAVSILNKVKKHVLEEPKRLNMGDWGRTSGTDNCVEFPACRTQGCIAGWTIFLTKPKIWKNMLEGAKSSGHTEYLDSNVHEPSLLAKDILGLDSEQKTRLFYAEGWPQKFDIAYQKTNTYKTRAAITAKRIDHFIATNGAE